MFIYKRGKKILYFFKKTEIFQSPKSPGQHVLQRSASKYSYIWGGNNTSSDKNYLKRVVKRARKIMNTNIPSIDELELK